jgi:hypothetical protein
MVVYLVKWFIYGGALAALVLQVINLTAGAGW